MESESKVVVFNEREGRGNIDEAGPGVLKTLFDHEQSEDGIKASYLIHQRIRTKKVRPDPETGLFGPKRKFYNFDAVNLIALVFRIAYELS